MFADTDPCYIIGEAGSNHDGDINQAIDLILLAGEAECDAVKFQCIDPFQSEWIHPLQIIAGECGLDFLATPFDVDAVRLLAEMGVPLLKIASPEIADLKLVAMASHMDVPVILSTGMASLGDIERALRICQDCEVALLQCTSRYPTPANQANLYAMETMRDAFNVPVGLSDHTLGIAVPIAAAALGAAIIEKHFTIDSTLSGPDHSYALEPDELKAMVSGIREAQAALGDGRKRVQEGEPVESRGRTIKWTM